MRVPEKIGRLRAQVAPDVLQTEIEPNTAASE
jgi:hypothetical protein